MNRANGHTKRITRTAFLGLISAYLLLTGCSGGGSSAIDLITPRAVSAVNVAGIKGPLAFADAKIFAFDPASPDFYHKNSPLSSAVTSQFATISGLSVPSDTAPPYILTIGGAGAIDIDTGMPPVISQLVTVVTQDMLIDGRPVYATPLTTLAFHMARLSTGQTTDANSFSRAFAAAADQVSQTFVMGQKVPIDILRSPLVMNDNTAAPGALKEAVYHRAAVETFAAQVYQLHLSRPDTTTDSFIESLALDLQADGIIDNSADGTIVGNIDPAVFRQPPMDLEIPNTSYRIRDVAALMQDERALLLADQGPEFLINREQSAPKGNALLSVDFENIDRGDASAVRYTKEQLESDFQWDMLGYSHQEGGNNYYGPLNAQSSSADTVWIVPDPAGNTGRGNVLRVTHAGGGLALNARADFTPVDEVYFAYDVYLPPGYEYMLQEKMPGLVSGSNLHASHPSYTQGPSADDPWRGVDTFTAVMQAETGTRGSSAVGVLGLYYYDALAVQQMNWLNTIDATSGSRTGQYELPSGQWITIEQHIKMNTADNDSAYDPAKDLNDGLAEVWINGVLMARYNHVWRKWQNLKCDGANIGSFYGGNPDDPKNIPSKTQYKYFDNFIVSTSPITH